jgi:hypothetical protein
MDFEPRVAGWLADVSDWTYGPAKPPPRAAGAEGRARTFESARAFAGAVDYPDRVAVAFRGTQPNVPDWLVNTQAAPVPCAFRLDRARDPLECGVHRGFLEEVNLVLGPLTAHLRSLPGLAGKRVYLTGHSQGGAEAVLAAAALEADGFEVAATYTFEAARAGDARLARFVRSPVHRFEYGNDVVPHLPADARLAQDPERLARAIVDGLAAATDLPDPVRRAVPGLRRLLGDATGALGGLLERLGARVPAAVEGVRTSLLALSSAQPAGSPLGVALRALADHLRPMDYRSLGALAYYGPGGMEEARPVSPRREVDLLYERVGRLPTDVPGLSAHHPAAAWRDRLPR